MEIKATIERIFPVQEVASKRNGEVYKKYAFLAKTQEEYPKQIYITCFGDDKWVKLNLIVNNTYMLSIDLSSRVYNDRYYTEVNCWRAVLLTDAPNAPQVQPPTSNMSQQSTQQQVNTTFTPQSTNDGLPF